jgi:hypothetical protein
MKPELIAIANEILSDILIEAAHILRESTERLTVKEAMELALLNMAVSDDDVTQH